MTTHLQAHGAGVNLPTNDEAPAVAAARGVGNHEQNQNSDFRADGAADQAVLTTDAESRMKAEAAMAGCSLHAMVGGGYLLTRWNLTKELPDLRAVAALLARMTGVRE